MALKRELSLTNLTLAVVTGTIGSGWLFAPYFTAKLAGGGEPLGLVYWRIDGFFVGAGVRRAGIRGPQFRSTGPDSIAKPWPPVGIYRWMGRLALLRLTSSD